MAYRPAHGGSTGPARAAAGTVVLGLSILLTGFVVAPPAAANGDRIYLDCPCEIDSDGTTARVTAGVRSFRSTDTVPLSLAILVSQSGGDYFIRIGKVTVAESLEADGSLESDTYEVQLEVDPGLSGSQDIELFLYEERANRPIQLDRVRMESPVDPTGAFRVADLDYLEDSDGDGVGDVNEGLAGTDPADAEATPPDSTLDVLALYSQSVPEIYGGDPTTRIQQIFVLANTLLADSGVDLSYRVVGLVEVELDESSNSSQPGPELRLNELDRHGADLAVLFRPSIPNTSCGYAALGGIYTRGHFEFRWESLKYATVFANCGARTLAHELGHVLGLGHSYWQEDVGTWRWSRGYAVDDDFSTIMTYGPQSGPYNSLDVFSSPQATCTGLLEVGKPCGIAGEQVNGADAVATLNAIRFQVASFRASKSDTDADGFVDPVDDLPDDPAEWRDTDGDGIGNNGDTDDDGDGVADADDFLPLDGSESADADGDGVGDNADAFPNDPDETSDADGDGVGDNSDVFPDDPAESADTDVDGVGDNADPWPENPAEHTDTDGDGIGDNADPDADNDGVADEVDAYPLDSEKSDLASYRFVGEQPGDQVGEILSRAGDGDQASFLIGAPQHDVDGKQNAGAVYLVAVSDLVTLDAADGDTDRVIGLGHVTSGTDSWKFVGDIGSDAAGSDVASSGDMDGDGQTDLIVGAPYFFTAGTRPGAAWFISGADFAAADAADGVTDQTIEMRNVGSQPRSWKFVGEAGGDRLGVSVAAVPDRDDDGSAELLFGASGYDSTSEHQSAGAAYLLASGEFAAADAADGATDGVIAVAHASGRSGSWKFVGESSHDWAGSSVSVPGEIGGNASIAINARYRTSDGAQTNGAAYLVSLDDLTAADTSDGQTDHVVDLARIAGQTGSWKLFNGIYGDWARNAVATASGDGGSGGWLILASDVASASDLTAADVADGSLDGAVDLSHLVEQPNSWRVGMPQVIPVGDNDGDGGDDLVGVASERLGAIAYLFSPARLADLDTENRPVDRLVDSLELDEIGAIRTIYGIKRHGEFSSSTAGDTDGDGLADILLGDPGPSTDRGNGSVYLILAADLAALDRVDEAVDRQMLLGNLAGDTDSDGIANTVDRDDDGDGVPDAVDAFHLDSAEWMDTDGDGTGDNADALPLDPRERLDTDGDGLGDFYADVDDDGDGVLDSDDQYPLDTDNDGIENGDETDDDNDGVADADDRFPVDPAESEDTDRDGVGNNADTDDDGDGVADADDSFPLDPAETADSDGDGVGDNGDAFPDDAAETHDLDGDGIGDNADTDDDGDGVADADDSYPLDAGASMDTDGDGVPDSRDVFPDNPREWADYDGSGIGDNLDSDDDNDGVKDVDDLFPFDGSRWDLTSVRFPLGVAHVGFMPDVASAGDLDDDGKSDLLIRAPGAESSAVVYVVSPSDLASADEADGSQDGSVEPRHVPSQINSWQLVGPDEFARGVAMSPLGDIDGAGFTEFFVGSGSFTPVGYIASGGDLLTADALDGSADGVIAVESLASQPGSWELQGQFRGGPLRMTVPADIDADRVVDLAIAQPGQGSGDSPGTVQVYAANALLSAVDKIGAADRVIYLGSGREGWKLVGEAALDSAGVSLAMADFDVSGEADLVIGAPGHDPVLDGEGAIYILGSRDLNSADLADGKEDGDIELGRIAALPNSWKFVGELAQGRLGRSIDTGDLDGDGRPDLVLGTRTAARLPMVSVVSGSSGNLGAIDLADGTADGTITFGSIAGGSNRQLTGLVIESLWNLDTVDFDGDDRVDLLVGLANYSSSKVAHFITGPTLFSEDGDSSESAVQFDEALLGVGSYQVYASEAHRMDVQVAVGAAGDVDADGLGDILLAVIPYTARSPSPPPGPGAVYLLVAADLPHLDAADGRMDGKIFLANVVRARR